MLQNESRVVTQQFPDMNYIGPDLGYRQYSGPEERQEQEEAQGGHNYTNNYYGQTGTMRSWEFSFFFQIVRRSRDSVWREREREIG